MPKRSNIKSILIIGSGPIIVGQACEFDYSGAQACLALREEGYRVILVNSNPATIMTDPAFSDATYIEPLTTEFLASIIKKERPDALLPTMGGQTSLNLALDLESKGILKEFNVELIGANSEVINRAEDRECFYQIVSKINLEHPESQIVKNEKDIEEAINALGFPLIMRSSFALGGKGSAIVNNKKELIKRCKQEFLKNPKQGVMLDQVLVGWKEFEMEVVRDKNDNCMVVCPIENIDPIGVHTGDSITVAPCLTLTDKEYQLMRDASFSILRAIGVETGGANVQFAIHPKTGKMLVIEMNPRVSRSSALASKATGFPIAKIAAKLAVGYSLDELKSDITGNLIPASFEPSLDYVVVKIPKFQFEKFSDKKDLLATQMQSVGEVMAIGRTFSEALLKAMRSFDLPNVENICLSSLSIASSTRLWGIFEALRLGFNIDDIYQHTKIDRWFLEEMNKIIKTEQAAQISPESFVALKRQGISDYSIGKKLQLSEKEVRELRKKWLIKPVFKRIDSCSAEFETPSSYLYSTYEQFCEAEPTNNRKVIILGSGPNTIGQGIEFDYCCVHAVKALQEMSYEVIMVNCNPETVSTDYNCADRLYCSPLVVEDLLEIIDKECPLGVFIQYGGQTPLNLAKELEENGVHLFGISSSHIDMCENRENFKKILKKLGLKFPKSQIVTSLKYPIPDFSYPVILRPSYVLSGNRMAIVYNQEELFSKLKAIFEALPGNSVLIEQFLQNAIEVEVDIISDGSRAFIPAILEHIELAGVHSGDSATSIRPLAISQKTQSDIFTYSKRLVNELNIKGLINIQFAVKDKEVYVLEINPRASRTVPFISKALGIDLVQIATKCVMGFSLRDNDCSSTKKLRKFFVKQPVFSRIVFGEVDLGPEMKSTGEVMGIGSSFREAYLKARIAAGTHKGSISTKNIQLESLQEIYKKH